MYEFQVYISEVGITYRLLSVQSQSTNHPIYLAFQERTLSDNREYYLLTMRLLEGRADLLIADLKLP